MVLYLRLFLLSWLVRFATGASVAQPAPKPVFETVATVFEPGNALPSETYATTRIPALVCTRQGTLLAFCEARVQNTSDWADMDILLRRSTDGGKTWLPTQVFAARQANTPTSNCTPIVDADGRTIHVLYHRGYSRCFYVRSIDEGATWSEPVAITAAFDAFRPEYNWKVLAPGPGHAIQLTHGPNKGRLVVPVWLCEPNPSVPGGDHRPSCVATVYSDDRGKTWQRGAIVANNGDGVDGQPLVNPSENVLVELSDGRRDGYRVMMNIRSESKAHRRAVAYSPDGVTNWTKPVFDSALFDPVCMASLLRLPDGALLFVNPDSRNDADTLRAAGSFRKRENLSAKLSTDDGRTWPINRVLYPGRAGYSDLAVAPDGMIYCLVETAEGDSQNWRYKVELLRFNQDWLRKQ